MGWRGGGGGASRKTPDLWRNRPPSGLCRGPGRVSKVLMRNRFYQAWDMERRSGRPDTGDFRTPFQIDRDRILHTPTFRKMQNKTQVFWSGEYDFYRTRLTHSLEVAQIGRSVCHWLRSMPDGVLADDYFIDPDLVEAACLSHDLGHPPFGHAGERTLNFLMEGYGGFEGNAQTLRLLTERIFTTRLEGMDPTRAFLDSILKYKSLWTEVRTRLGKAPKNHFLYDFQHAWLDWALGSADFPPELPAGEERDGFKSIECQIMDWADDTAYSLNDLSDSVRAGFLSVDRIERWGGEQDSATGELLVPLVRALRGGRIEPFVGSRIGTYIRAARLVPDANFLSESSHRYRFRLSVEEGVRRESETFKRLAFDLVFLSPQLKQLEHKGNFMLRRLWETLHQRYVRDGHIDGLPFQLLPVDTAGEVEREPRPEIKARILCDFLASLTDGEAARMYKRLFVADFGSIGDLVG